MDSTTPWVLKYFPQNIDEMVLSKDLHDFFDNVIKTKKLSNYSFFGHPGCGKTTLAKLLVNKLECEYLFQPCSIDGSIDMIKTKIVNFCEIVGQGKYKIIILDEADQLSQQAQMALRNIIVEAMDDCRFILTANFQDKIIDALKSRCTPIKLEFSTQDILKHCVKILKNEGIKYDKNTLVEFYKNIIVTNYPDIRTILEHLQMMSISGKLIITKSDSLIIGNEIINKIVNEIKTFDIRKIREYLLSNEDKFSADYVQLAQKLFDYYDDNAEIMMTIADSLWRMSFQLDKEIQFTNMLINIQLILNKR